MTRVILAAVAIAAAVVASPAPVTSLPQCATEDSPSCVWDSLTQGDGQRGPGVARYIVNGPEIG